MKPLVHAKFSVARYGGTVDDYIEVHEFLDSSKAHVPDSRHRALLHNSFGPFLAVQVFGHYVTNTDGKKVSVRDLCEEHIVQDCGSIPTVSEWFTALANDPLLKKLVD